MTGHVYAPNALLPSFQGLQGPETQLNMKRLWRVIRISAAPCTAIGFRRTLAAFF
ncbi:hypothetical protein [Agrobacterium vitis]|uniref:Uncharacterized protein n=1 Tax=Agrobacterium vitis TaxID=373 RepID=A0AAE2UQP4_AGRVI|nr:hypothetical protein [Agrobacterium vitis]MBF2715877.1 hypothetical protein [Agrobacterium vitis]MUZ65937.1 hypothetical protein [Agrobacterium vitis]